MHVTTYVWLRMANHTSHKTINNKLVIKIDFHHMYNYNFIHASHHNQYLHTEL